MSTNDTRERSTEVNDRIAVIESDDYRREVDALTDDPIIIAMYATLPGDWADFDSYDFMIRSSEEYHARGGERAQSIGGPARAIKRLATEVI